MSIWPLIESRDGLQGLRWWPRTLETDGIEELRQPSLAQDLRSFMQYTCLILSTNPDMQSLATRGVHNVLGHDYAEQGIQPLGRIAWLIQMEEHGPHFSDTTCIAVWWARKPKEGLSSAASLSARS